MEIAAEDRIIKIYRELLERNIIDPQHKLEASNNLPGAFKSGFPFSKKISYNPKLCKDLTNDEVIRFCLLHEEGHLKTGQYGIPCLCLLLFIGFAPLIIYALLKIFLIIDISSIIIVISLFFALFVLFSSVRILAEPFYWDEFGSDEFASKILFNCYGIRKPSQVVKITLSSIPSTFNSSKLLHRLFLGFFEYHPSNELRVRNIAEFIDEIK
jgi:Zn-dependent protease with chaperone function